MAKVKILRVITTDAVGSFQPKMFGSFKVMPATIGMNKGKPYISAKSGEDPGKIKEAKIDLRMRQKEIADLKRAIAHAEKVEQELQKGK